MKKDSAQISIHEQVLQLLPEGALYLPHWDTLVIADLHLGKAAHFRKNGIPLPAQVDEANWFLLGKVLDRFPSSNVVFLGDLFHSDYNPDWDNMTEITEHYSDHIFTLVKGNHDILPEEMYSVSRLSIADELELGTFLLTHHPMEEVPSGKYNLAGHIHPGVRLKGKGRQRISVPCFYFNEQNGILPAFGSFKGKYHLKPEKGSRIFVLTSDAVIEASANF